MKFLDRVLSRPALFLMLLGLAAVALDTPSLGGTDPQPPAAETECARTMADSPPRLASSSARRESTARRADLVMREVTARMSEGPNADGLDQNGLSVDQLVALYDRGERLYIQCALQAQLAQAILARNGVRSRIIGTLAAEGPWDYQGDGHQFLEIWTGRHWIAYDPDGNRQPVDAHGNAMGAVRAAHTRPFHWRYIAADSYTGAYRQCSFEQLDPAVDHAMGIVAIQTSAPGEPWVFSYHVGPALRARVEGYGIGWTWVGKKRWAKITRGES